MTLKDDVLDELYGLEEEPQEEQREAPKEDERQEEDDFVAEDFPLQEVPPTRCRFRHLLRKPGK